MEEVMNIYKPSFAFDQLREAIQAEYKEVACNVDHTIHFTSGKKLAQRLGYSEEVMKMMPADAIRPFAGVGNPFSMGMPEDVEAILDIGSGAGFDLIYTALSSGKKVEYYGIDMTEEMVEQAKKNAIEAGIEKMYFMHGYAEELPFISGTIDLVVSNGVINLVPDKPKVFSEIYRVLKPGGRFQISDVLLELPVPERSKDMIHLWTNCVAGAVTHQEYLEIIEDAGFIGTEVHRGYDVFQDARIARSAAYFGAKGYDVMGFKIKK
jgi:arsenite methyltransferase